MFKSYIQIMDKFDSATFDCYSMDGFNYEIWLDGEYYSHANQNEIISELTGGKFIVTNAHSIIEFHEKLVMN